MRFSDSLRRFQLSSGRFHCFKVNSNRFLENVKTFQEFKKLLKGSREAGELAWVFKESLEFCKRV